MRGHLVGFLWVAQPVMVLGSPGTLLVKKEGVGRPMDGESSLVVKSLYGGLMIQSWNVMQ